MNFRRVGGEVPVGHVDRDPLLPLGLQAVHEQRQVDLPTGRAHDRGIGLQVGQVVLVDHLGVVEESPDEGGLAVVDAAAGQKAQQVLALVLGQVGLDVGGDEVGGMCAI